MLLFIIIIMKSVKETVEFDKIVEYISEFAITEFGHKLVLNAEIFDSPDKIKEQTQYTTEARKLYDLNLKVPIENFSNITHSLQEAKRRLRISAQEIWDIANFLRISRVVKTFLEKNEEEAPMLAAKSSELCVLKELEDKIFDTLDSTMMVKESASSELRRLYKQASELSYSIKACINRLLNDNTFAENLRDTIYTQRDGRTVFQVKAEAKNKILGIVHDVSATGQTFYIEPKELTELHNKEKETEIAIKTESERILRVFSDEIGANYFKIQKSSDILAELDFHFAKGRYSQKTESVPAKISDTPKIYLQSMRNPILMRVCDNVIENDFLADNQNYCTIITGSNTGGKTVVLKTVGLLTLMAKAGFHVPCISADIFPFKKIYADIGDQQNIIQSLSTFSSHIKNLAEMTNEADSSTLILIDEICSGTDPAEGTSLARAILKDFVNKNAFSVVTTHFGELKNLALEEKGFENASVRFDTETLKPTYRFTQGVSGSSNAITIAENLGLSKKIIKSSKEIFTENSGKMTEKFSKLEEMWEEASKKLDEAKKKAAEAGILKRKLEMQYEDLKKEKRKIISEYKKRTQSEFDFARDEIKEILKELRQDKTHAKTMVTIRKNNQIRKNLHDKLSGELDNLQDEYTDIDINLINENDKVIIKELNQEAVFIRLTDKNKKAVILMGNVTTTIPVKKLAVFDKSLLKPKIQPLIHQKSVKEFKKYDISYTLDLRGYRYEEAMREVEAYLDKACEAGLNNAIIIHGHGTGVLKKAIREYLSESPYVAKFRPGEDVEGGDGVSVVDLN